jgi:hypothetical protein
MHNATERLRLYRLLALLLCPFANAAANPRIVPVRTNAAFSSQTSERRWSVPIKTIDGRTAYILSLEPEFDIRQRPLTLDIVLRRPGDKAGSPNLLEPNRQWHGLQPWMFNANDLALGPQKSGYGKTRTLTLKN